MAEGRWTSSLVAFANVPILASKPVKAIHVFALLQPPSNPIIVRIPETPPVESTSIPDILLGALGLTGVMLLSALLLGLVLGGVLIGVKLLRARLNLDPSDERDALRVTPGGTT
jgi:hypothetical protein